MVVNRNTDSHVCLWTTKQSVVLVVPQRRRRMRVVPWHTCTLGDICTATEAGVSVRRVTLLHSSFCNFGSALTQAAAIGEERREGGGWECLQLPIQVSMNK